MRDFLDTRNIMEALNSLWTIGVIVVVLILAIYCRHHYRGSGWASQVKLGSAIGILLMGDIVQRSTIWWWHHQFNNGVRVALDVYYPALAVGCTFAIVGIFVSIRILSEAYWGWPSCLRVSAVVLALAAVLVLV